MLETVFDKTKNLICFVNFFLTMNGKKAKHMLTFCTEVPPRNVFDFGNVALRC